MIVAWLWPCSLSQSCRSVDNDEWNAYRWVTLWSEGKRPLSRTWNMRRWPEKKEDLWPITMTDQQFSDFDLLDDAQAHAIAGTMSHAHHEIAPPTANESRIDINLVSILVSRWRPLLPLRPRPGNGCWNGSGWRTLYTFELRNVICHAMQNGACFAEKRSRC